MQGHSPKEAPLICTTRHRLLSSLVPEAAIQLRLLMQVSEAIATHRDLTTLFRDLARRLPAIVPFELIALFLHDPDKNVMRVHMLGGADGDRIPPGLEVPVDASFSGLAFTTQQPVIVRTARRRGDSPPRRRWCSSSASSRSACCR